MPGFPDHIFREYDVRGIVGLDIDAALAYRLGRAFAAMLPAEDARPVSVGRDVRLSGPELQQATMQGLADAGRDIIDIGITPTPLAYFSVFALDTAGSLQVTASHNPGEYNGFKMMIGRESLHGSDIQKLKRQMQTESAPSSRKGKIRSHRIDAEYIEFVVRDCPLSRPLKVVIDAGNGPSGLIAGPLYRRLGCEVIELYCEPDGSFPNHHPDPTIAANLRDLADRVRDERADLGIAFDGDGDRIGVVDERGDIIAGDMLLLILARQLLREHPGATIISEVKASERLYREIRKAGGQALMWRTGHSPIKARMRETGALLAGEMSGHMFFADRFYGFDDATYAGARLMQILADANAPLSSLLADVEPAFATPEIRIPCADGKKFGLIERAREYFASLGLEIIAIDGVRIRFADGWGLIRASNTQPALVLRFEADTPERLQEIRQLIEGWLARQPEMH